MSTLFIVGECSFHLEEKTKAYDNIYESSIESQHNIVETRRKNVDRIDDCVEYRNSIHDIFSELLEIENYIRVFMVSYSYLCYS